MTEADFQRISKGIDERLNEISDTIHICQDTLTAEQLHVIYGKIIDWKYTIWDIRIRDWILRKYAEERGDI